jgi:hypothetical protein
MEENEEEILKIRKKILSRNPHAFQKKINFTEQAPSKIDVVKSLNLTKSKVRHIKG